MSISMRVSEREKQLIKDFAELNGMSVSDYIKTVVMEKIEDEIDLKAYEEGMRDYRREPETYTLDEVIARYGKPEEV